MLSLVSVVLRLLSVLSSFPFLFSSRPSSLDNPLQEEFGVPVSICPSCGTRLWGLQGASFLHCKALMEIPHPYLAAPDELFLGVS